MARPTLPHSLDQITPEWVTQMLANSMGAGRTTVIGVGAEVIGEEKGFLSQVARLDLDFDGQRADLPSSIVVKLEPASDDQVTTAKEIRAFEREVRFYKEIAPTIDLRLPRIFFAETTP